MDSKTENIQKDINWTKWNTIAATVIGIIGIVVVLFFQKESISSTQSMKNSPGATQVQINAPVGGDVNMNTPAIYSASTTFVGQTNGKYLATIKIFADKKTNLPNYLCVVIKTDVISGPFGKPGISNDGIGISSTEVDSNYECISNPSPYITAQFLLEKKPDIFEVHITDQKP